MGHLYSRLSSGDLVTSVVMVAALSNGELGLIALAGAGLLLAWSTNNTRGGQAMRAASGRGEEKLLCDLRADPNPGLTRLNAHATGMQSMRQGCVG